MPKYTTNYTNHGLAYTEIKRHNNICLFEGIAPSGRKEYEVHILRLKPAHPKASDAGTMILSSPSTSDWGVYGFTYQSKDRAMAKFRKLSEKNDLDTDSSDSVAA